MHEIDVQEMAAMNERNLKHRELTGPVVRTIVICPNCGFEIDPEKPGCEYCDA